METITMSKNWIKLGCIFNASGESSWMQSHAFLPTPHLLSDDEIRIYISFLDKNKVGRIGYVDVSAQDPTKIIKVSNHVVMDIGEPGSFDDNGVTPMCVLKDQNKLRMYYTGWQLSYKVRYFLFTGLAESNDGGETFKRLKQVPILERSDNELIVRTAAHVIKENNLYRMWYIGGSKTIVVDNKQVPTYDMRYCESSDGITFPSTGKVVLSPNGKDEYGFGRPYICPLPNDEGYEMWYSIRSRSGGYDIGYANSSDGVIWNRHDTQSGIKKSIEGWDNNMIAFGAVCDTKYGKYFFYNGNNYGETGFGVAIRK